MIFGIFATDYWILITAYLKNPLSLLNRYEKYLKPKALKKAGLDDEKYKSLNANNDIIYAKSIEIANNNKIRFENKILNKDLSIARQKNLNFKTRKEVTDTKQSKLNTRNQQISDKKKEILKDYENKQNALREESYKENKIVFPAQKRIKIFADKLESYDNLQKKNYEDVIKEMNLRNGILNTRHYIMMNAAENNEKLYNKNAKKSQKETLSFNDYLENRYECFCTEMKDLSYDSILNKSQEQRLKMYYKLKNEEKERLEKEKLENFKLWVLKY